MAATRTRKRMVRWLVRLALVAVVALPAVWAFAQDDADEPLTLTVFKTSDANQDQIFSKGEQITVQPGGLIVYDAKITNTSGVDVIITGLIDEAPPGSGNITPQCPGLIGTTLPANQSVSCRFSMVFVPPSNANRFTAFVETKARLVPITPPSGGQSGGGFCSEHPNDCRPVPCNDVDPGCLPPCPEEPPPTTTTIPPVRCLKGRKGQASDDDAGFFIDVVLPLPPAISIDKTNDADGDGRFNDSETAPASGAPVTFRAVITNIGATPLTITGLTDEYPGVGPTPICNLIGTTLPVGESVTCTFTVTGYAPAPGALKVDTVSVTALEVCNVPGLCLQRPVDASDTSIVGTAVPPPSTPGISIDKTNDADGDGTFNATNFVEVEVNPG